MQVTRQTKVGLLGPFGTYSHEVASGFFGGEAHYHAVANIQGVFQSLAAGQVDYGVVPQENTIFGSVIETYDSLRLYGDTFVRGELILPVDHCLLVKTGVQLGDIVEVLSHEQALGQCANFVRQHLPNASTQATASTAAAARMLLDRPPTSAAISSRACANIYDGLEVLREGIQRDEANFTRFYVLTRRRNVPIPSLPDTPNSRRKGLLRIINKSPTSLSSSQGDILAALNQLSTEMEVVRIDRRPAQEGVPFQDLYFTEVQGSNPSPSAPVLEGVWDELLDSFVSKVKKLGFEASVMGSW
ncbi:Prephenate dehydratase-domain-containing protein [Ephemerocybe angulata]|uniref:prephenate dehydratase n=1 Tax=Ephemerocybe angulata TaxID=980116 RepID=A0A8H6IKR0_9AGAR|nr:Prephenate dehydratase-domain-containing protein [Tulosesus angulatus]